MTPVQIKTNPLALIFTIRFTHNALNNTLTDKEPEMNRVELQRWNRFTWNGFTHLDFSQSTLFQSFKKQLCANFLINQGIFYFSKKLSHILEIKPVYLKTGSSVLNFIYKIIVLLHFKKKGQYYIFCKKTNQI